MKLFRLAAPGSGASEPERISAALEAAKIVAKEKLIILTPDGLQRLISDGGRAAEKAGFYAKSRRKPRETNSDWLDCEVSNLQICVACGKPIYGGERAWFHDRQGFRHHDITCDTPSR